MAQVFLTQSGGIIMGPISKVLGWILNMLFNFLSYFHIENAGLTIILFTFLVNALMIPFTIKQQKFSKLSTKVTPEINKISEKYKGKNDEASLQKQQLEMQAVYQKYGVSPTSGCLPMLITFPIMFALYRVIYNIPAYVDAIKVLYENIAVAMQGTDYVAIMTEYATKFNLNVSKWGDISTSIPVINLIDIMAQFKAVDWQDLMANSAFASIASVISTNSAEIMKINEFGFGLNIMETPWQQIFSHTSIWVKIAYVIVPVLAGATQMLATKIMMGKQPQSETPNDMASATMRSMNMTMPIFMGIMCLMTPIGVGIYIVAGSVFRIIQQIFVDRYLDKMDIDEIIEKNKKKQEKKKKKMGIDPNVSVEDVARMHTSTIRDKARANTGVRESEKDAYEPVEAATEYAPGSIGAYAHMLGRSNGKKESR